MNRLWSADLLVCLLEPGNVHRLKINQPIEIDLADGPWKQGIPPKAKLVIAYSETPVADMRTFKGKFPEMQVEDQRTPVSEKKRPHCPECKSTIEQLGVWRSDESPLWLTFCYVCGCVFGVSQPIEQLRKK